MVDIMGNVDGYRLGLYLTDPGRCVPPALTRLTGKKCGVISLRLDDLQDRFRNCDRSRESYRSILERHLSAGTCSKKWVYHPRKIAIEKDAKAVLQRKLQTVQQEFRSRRKNRINTNTNEQQTRPRTPDRRVQNLPENERKHYCLLCGHIWTSVIHEQELHCPSCGKSGCIS